MANYHIIVGSMLGASEYVADALAEILTQHGISNKIHLLPDLTDINPEDRWIICTSTHGAGELPDNIKPFAHQLENAKLSGLEFLIVGLGDSSYDTFCYGAKSMQVLLQKAGATLLHQPLLVDVLEHPIPEDSATEWLKQYLTE